MDLTAQTDVIGHALAIAQSSDGLMDDFAARLFPKTNIGLSDRLLSNSRLALHKLVAEIESELSLIAITKIDSTNEMLTKISEGTHNISHDLLDRAGILRDPAILAPVFTHAQRMELHSRLLQKFSQNDLEAALTRNLDHQNAAIADAAMAVLVAQNRAGSQAELLYSELSAEYLFNIVWTVAAALEQASGYAGDQISSAAGQLLSAHDESSSVQNRALRLASLLEQEAGDDLHPLQDGLDLSFARLSLRSGISTEQLIQYSAEPRMARLVVTLRAIGQSAEQALSIFAALDVAGDVAGAMPSAASYNEIQFETAKQLVSSWSSNAAYRIAKSRLNANQDIF